MKSYIYTITPQLIISKEILIYARNNQDAVTIKELFENKQYVKLTIKEIKTTRKNSNEYKRLIEKFKNEEGIINAEIETAKNMRELLKQ